MDFNKYRKSETLKIEFDLGTHGIQKLLEYLVSHPEIVVLDLSTSSIVDESVKALADSKNILNLQSVDLSFCDKLTDESVKVLADSKNFPNLASVNLSFCGNLTDEFVKTLADSKNFPNLQSVDFSSCGNLTDESVKALADSKNFPNLQSVNLSSCDKLTGRVIDIMEESRSYWHLNSNYRSLLRSLASIEVVKDTEGFSLETAIKDLLFDIAPFDNGWQIKYCLDTPEKYPFLINSTDRDGHTIAYFHNHDPVMQKFFFEKGMVPIEQGTVLLEQDTTLRDIATGMQSVHHSEAVKRTNFIASELVNSTNLSTSALQEKAEIYEQDVSELFSNNNDLPVGLLDLTVQEKKLVMENTLKSGIALPDDNGFINIVKAKNAQLLKDVYLNKQHGYYNYALQYDWTEGAEKTITIPESIGLIQDLIEKTEPTRAEKQELSVTLLAKNPKVMLNYISAPEYSLEQLSDKSALHNILNSVDEKKITEIFEDLSKLNIVDVWREQQKFKLAKDIYIAATAYENNPNWFKDNACEVGTCSQIIDAAAKIDLTLEERYAELKEKEIAAKMARPDITEENIKSFSEKLVADELLKKNGKVLSNPELKGAFLDLAIANLDINDPTKLNKEEQQILSIVNTYFSEHIKESLPNYDRDVPTPKQYKAMIDAIPEVGAIENFVRNPDIYFIGDLPNLSGMSVAGDENRNRQGTGPKKSRDNAPAR